MSASRARQLVADIGRRARGGDHAPPDTSKSAVPKRDPDPVAPPQPAPPTPTTVVLPAPGAGPAQAPPEQAPPEPAPPARGSKGGTIGSALGGLLGGVIAGSRGAVRDVIGAIFRRHGSAEPAGRSGDADAVRGGPDVTATSGSRERALQADVRLAESDGVGPAEVLDAFCPGATHSVDISLGRGASVQAGVAFVQPAFEDGQDSVQLDLRLIHDEQVTGGRIDLPRDERANSSVWSARLFVAADLRQVEALVVVLHKGRVLQAARLSGPVREHADAAPAGQAITLSVIADVHQFAYLETRGAFDASVVSSDGAGAAFAGESFGVQDLRGIEPTVSRIMDRLFRSSEAIAMSGSGNELQRQRELLVYLAAHGKALHGALIKPRLAALDGAARIQIVNVGGAPILPLELIYDGPSPTHDATLCTGWQEALEQGVCPSCRPVPPGTRVATICPLHFWALAKVIERHAPGEPRADGYDYTLDTCVPGQRDRLAPLRHALFAASDNVPEERVEETLAALRRLEPGCDEAGTWADWLGIVKDKAPTLLVSMPHNALDPVLDIPTLEIGRGSDLRAGEVCRQHVCPDDADVGPVVLLLGCQTAQGGPLPYHSFVNEFRSNGAAIVIGTLATVLGEHAAPIVQAMLAELAEPAAASEHTFGDVLLRMRRRMFARGILISLAVTAFGDAEWTLPAIGEAA